MTVGEKIKIRRKKLHMSQGELARKCGMSLMSIRRYEDGERDLRLEDLTKIAGALNLQTIDLIDDQSSAELGARRQDCIDEIYALLQHMNLSSIKEVLTYTQYILATK